jgi:chaperonin GroES
VLTGRFGPVSKKSGQRTPIDIFDNPVFFRNGALGMKLRPLHDRIVVKRLDNENKTASGIVIPDNAAEKPDQGEVIAVGNGKILDDGKVRALDVKVGDKILFGKYSGQTVKVDGDELLVLREDDVMAVIA